MHIVSRDQERDEIVLAFTFGEAQRPVKALVSAADRIYRSDMMPEQKRSAAAELWSWVDRLNGVVWEFKGEGR